MQRAVVAQPDGPIVTALRGADVEGVWSEGFSCGLALIFTNGCGVGLVHSSGRYGFAYDIETARVEFTLLTGQTPRLTIGYHLDTLRAHLGREARHASAAEFARAHGCPPPRPGADEDTAREKTIDYLLSRHEFAAISLARSQGADCVRLPGSFVAVSSDGSMLRLKGSLRRCAVRPVP